jgi:hypothetical protein
MASNKTMTNNSNDIKEIERLWVMGGASVMKDRNTHDIVAYTCYCDECKTKSVKGDGGIAFHTAEHLLAHRKMKAFTCPCGCGFHICEEFGSIVRHLDAFHKEVLKKLENEGLDLSTKKRVWIYPDFVNNTYTLTKPMPEMNESPLVNAGIILAMSPPRRLAATPPVPEQERDKLKPKPKKNGKYVPFNTSTVATVATVATAATAATAASKPVVSGPPKTWGKTDKPVISFAQAMSEQKEKTETANEVASEYVRPTHYAQEDMRKEKQCQYGKGCVKRDRPFACALNHDCKGDIITRGTELTDSVLCPFERPPFKRCGDGRCTKIHLEHRSDFIEQKKKQFFESDPQEKMSYDSVAGTLKKEKTGTTTAVITTSAKGTTIMMSREDAQKVAAALQKLDKQEQQEEDEWNSPRNAFNDSSSEKMTDDEEETEDTDDLSDPATFAARVALVNLARNSEQ